MIGFEQGTPVSVDGKTLSPAALLGHLNKLAGAHGVGRVDLVENRFVGLKSRGVYETPGGTILYSALRDLEGIAMDREVLRLRDSLSPIFTQLIYNGFWFSPEMEFIQAAFRQAERLIDGRVRLQRLGGGTPGGGRGPWRRQCRRADLCREPR